MNGRCSLVVVAAIGLIDLRVRNWHVGRLLHGGDGSGQRMTVVGIAFTQVDAHDPVSSVCGGDRYFLAKLITFVSLAFANALHVRLVKAVELLAVGLSLSVQSFAPIKQRFQRRIGFWHFAAPVAKNSAQPRLPLL